MEYALLKKIHLDTDGFLAGKKTEGMSQETGTTQSGLVLKKLLQMQSSTEVGVEPAKSSYKGLGGQAGRAW